VADVARMQSEIQVRSSPRAEKQKVNSGKYYGVILIHLLFLVFFFSFLVDIIDPLKIKKEKFSKFILGYNE